IFQKPDSQDRFFKRLPLAQPVFDRGALGLFVFRQFRAAFKPPVRFHPFMREKRRPPALQHPVDPDCHRQIGARPGGYGRIINKFNIFDGQHIWSLPTCQIRRPMPTLSPDWKKLVKTTAIGLASARNSMSTQQPPETIIVDNDADEVCCDGGTGAMGHPAVWYT